jgi:hypothetical protein
MSLLFDDTKESVFQLMKCRFGSTLRLTTSKDDDINLDNGQYNAEYRYTSTYVPEYTEEYGDKLLYESDYIRLEQKVRARDWYIKTVKERPDLNPQVLHSLYKAFCNHIFKED